MSDRPGYLIVVTHAGQDGVDLWSAHYTEDEAALMHERLAALLSATTSRAHLIAVPEDKGVVKAATLMRAAPATAAAPVAAPAPVPAPAEPPPPFKRISPAAFEEETRQMMENALNGIGRDADDPLSDGGAFS
jgi:hypothetical protein